MLDLELERFLKVKYPLYTACSALKFVIRLSKADAFY